MKDPAAVSPHSVLDGTLPAEPPHFPIVILRAGLGALTTSYTTLAEDIASHGYVVVGFDAPYRTSIVVFADGLDLQKIGVVGHSLGGATAAQFCHEDARCGAGIDMDGALHGSVIEEDSSGPSCSSRAITATGWIPSTARSSPTFDRCTTDCRWTAAWACRFVEPITSASRINGCYGATCFASS